MKTLKDIATEQQKSRPEYFDDPQKDRMIALIIELAEEVCVLRDQVDNAQRLAAAGATATPEALRDFVTDDDLVSERLARHKAFFDEIFGRLID